MKTQFAALMLVGGVAVSSFAAEIKNGAVMQVKPNSIWFQDASQLTRWQELKKSGHEAAYQEKALSDREAWQFTSALTVKILAYDPAKKQVHVQMQTEGRMRGTDWFVDASAVAR